jgi:signal transduction histidine kinase
MRFKTWPVAALGLGGLLVLAIVSMLASARRAQEVYTNLNELNTFHRSLDTHLQQLRTDVNRTEIVARDYLLDLERGRFSAVPDGTNEGPDLATDYRRRLLTLRERSEATLEELRALPQRSSEQIASLQSKLGDYWHTLDPLLELTPAAISQGETRYLRREMVPRREAILAVTRELQELNDTNMAAQRAAVTRRQEAFRSDFRNLLWETILLGVAVALVAVFRLRTLERRSAQQQAATEEAERQTRELSRQLVAAQEEERKNLSRELHDDVGQVLTALRMELGKIERAKAAPDVVGGGAVAECKRLVDSLFRTVRDISLGLRPTMLDDFGLQPALEWQVRDLTGRYNVEVDLRLEGDLEVLPDRYRTCVYRAVQEALTNCVRHAKARAIKVCVALRPDALNVSVTDDGVGLDPSRRRAGLGLRGIEERVKELHGVMTIDRAERGGTHLAINLPLPDTLMEMPLARAAS